MPIIITPGLYDLNPLSEGHKSLFMWIFLKLGMNGKSKLEAPNNKRSLRGKCFASICPKTWGCTCNPSPPRFKDSEKQKYSNRKELDTE